MNTQHTPSPWHIGKRAAAVYVYGPLGEEIAGPSAFTSGHEETLANARLIAAAPDLLHACEQMLSVTGGSNNWNGETHIALTLIEAAIAKAKPSTITHNEHTPGRNHIQSR